MGSYATVTISKEEIDDATPMRLKYIYTTTLSAGATLTQTIAPTTAREGGALLACSAKISTAAATSYIKIYQWSLLGGTWGALDELRSVTGSGDLSLGHHIFGAMGNSSYFMVIRIDVYNGDTVGREVHTVRGRVSF